MLSLIFCMSRLAFFFRVFVSCLNSAVSWSMLTCASVLMACSLGTRVHASRVSLKPEHGPGPVDSRGSSHGHSLALELLGLEAEILRGAAHLALLVLPHARGLLLGDLERGERL